LLVKSLRVAGLDFHPIILYYFPYVGIIASLNRTKVPISISQEADMNRATLKPIAKLIQERIPIFTTFVVPNDERKQDGPSYIEVWIGIIFDNRLVAELRPDGSDLEIVPVDYEENELASLDEIVSTIELASSE
jgi:hypothetical protein